MKTSFCLMSTLLFAAFGWGCGSSPAGQGDREGQVSQASTPREAATDIPASALQSAVTANNTFAIALFQQELTTSGSSNALTSPISASLALTMAYAGARGQTATEMAKALQFDPSAATSMFAGQNALSQALAGRGATAFAAARMSNDLNGPGSPAPSADDYELSVVNSMWGQRTETWATPFLTTLAQSYGAGVHLEDFIDQPDQARLDINNWVYDATQDKIANLLPEGAIDSTTRLVLANAVHLRFPWASPFDATASAPGTFTRADGTTVSPTFMNQQLTVPYIDDGQAQIALLPLSDGNPVTDNTPTADGLSVIIALPHQGVTLATYAAGLSAASAVLQPPTSSALVQLSLPKLTFTTPSFSLKQALEAMGMVQAFNPAQADFSGMTTTDQLYVEDVLQKAMVSMQETGVEAAAATAVTVATLAAVVTPPTPVPMIVNRPYLVSIVDSVTGAVLFLGQVTDPTEAGQP